MSHLNVQVEISVFTLHCEFDELHVKVTDSLNDVFLMVQDSASFYKRHHACKSLIQKLENSVVLLRTSGETAVGCV